MISAVVAQLIMPADSGAIDCAATFSLLPLPSLGVKFHHCATTLPTITG